jgi:hypothetical protein
VIEGGVAITVVTGGAPGGLRRRPDVRMGLGVVAWAAPAPGFGVASVRDGAG